MDYIQTLIGALYSAFGSAWFGTMMFIPKFIGSLIILIIGLIVAAVLGSIVDQVVRGLKIDSLLKRLGVEEYTSRGGIKLNSGHFLGKIVYWFTVVVFILAASDVLGLERFSEFLKEDVLSYIPKFAIAALIMVATLAVAKFAKATISASVASAHLHAPKFLGTFVWWTIFIFGFVTALMQLGINVYIFQMVLTGFVAMLTIAGGLAFGLAGKDYAAGLINRLKQETE